MGGTIGKREDRGAQAALFALVLLLFLGTTIGRNSVYRDEETFWSAAVRHAPGKARPHYNLGNAYRGRGKMDQAVRQWLRAVEINPRYSQAYNQLGNVFFLSGDFAKADYYYSLAVASEPGNAEAHYNLAQTADRLGKYQEAVEQYRLFLRMDQMQPEGAVREARSRIQALERR